MSRLTTLLAGALLALSAAAQPPAAIRLTPDLQAAIVDSCASILQRQYIFAETADEIAARWRSGLVDGRYAAADELMAFCQALHDDGREICRDKHFGVRPAPPAPPAPPEGADGDAELERWQERSRRDHYGWKRVEILPGNVGYVELTGFSGDPRSQAVAAAAMQFLAGVDALVFDLRGNGGGDPKMIQLISTYLLGDEVHLNSFYIRETDRWEQYWTLPYVPGDLLLEQPVYVLTSSNTFSAAEEFSYNLQQLERATLVGETTGGGAHPVDDHRFDFAGGVSVEIRVPFGRAVNPVSGTNWEGVGVVPQIAVPADEALQRARLEIAQRALETEEDVSWRERLGWDLVALRAEAQPVELGRKQLKAYAGQYGERRIWVEDGHLRYQRGEGRRMTLRPLGEDLFASDLDWFRLRFERDEAGRIVAATGLYAGDRQGPPDRSPRD